MSTRASIWPLHSMLYIPAHKIEWVRKVARFAPDAVILDLEDAVPRHLKEEARGIAREAIGLLRGTGIAAFVRINGWKEGGPADVAAVTVPGLAGIQLAKTDSAEEIRELDLALAYAEGRSGLEQGSVDIVALPETTRGVYEMYQIAGASKRCKSVAGMVGPVNGDVARAMGFLPTMEGSEQLYLASKTVLDSRAGGAPYPVGAVIGMRIDDLDAVRMLCTRARHLGFSGAVLIHPSHVAIANEVFAPTPAEVAYAQGLIEAMKAAESSGSSAVQYHGQMVDYAMLPQAHAVMREAQRRGIRAEGQESRA